MQATSFPFGTLAIPGGWRYHPVIVAQAAATLAEMFPGRLPWIAAGSGEAMNEHITGEGWPLKEERNMRLEAGVDIIRALWRGETVTRKDGPIDVHLHGYGLCRLCRQKFTARHYLLKRRNGLGDGRMGC